MPNQVKRNFKWGIQLDLSDKVTLHINVPSENSEIKIIHNGNEVASFDTLKAEFSVKKPGAYRVEVYFFNKAWIYSNHIRIGI